MSNEFYEDDKIEKGKYTPSPGWLLRKILFVLGIFSLFVPAGVAIYIIIKLKDVVISGAGAYVAAFWGSIPIILTYVAYSLIREQLTVKIDKFLSNVSSLSLRYFQQFFIKAWMGLCITNLFALASWFFDGDTTVFWIPMAYTILCFSYSGVLYLRVKSGYFGTNKHEIRELVEYLFEVSERSDGPPGIRRLSPGFGATSSAVWSKINGRKSTRGANG